MFFLDDPYDLTVIEVICFNFQFLNNKSEYQRPFGLDIFLVRSKISNPCFINQ